MVNASPIAIDSRKAPTLSLVSHQPKFSYTKLYSGIANKIGLAKAYLIQEIKSWCQSNKKHNRQGYFHNNEWWSSGTYREWAQMYPALGKDKNVQRLFLALEKEGYIISAQPNKLKGDATKFYRINSAKVDNLFLQDSSVVQEKSSKNDTNVTALPLLENNSGVDEKNSRVVENNSGSQPETYALQSSQPSSNINTVILSNQITGEWGEQEKEEEVTSYQDPEIKSSASTRDKVEPINSACPANKNQDFATTSTSTHEDDIPGAADENGSHIGEVFTGNTEVARSTVETTENVEVIQDTLPLTFDSDPLKEETFLSYYKSSLERSHKKTIGSIRGYVEKMIANSNGADVLAAFNEWKRVCSALGCKINDFAKHPEEIAKQKHKYDFANWSTEEQDTRFNILMQEGLKKFCANERDARWYEWAIATHPGIFADPRYPIPA